MGGFTASRKGDISPFGVSGGVAPDVLSTFMSWMSGADNGPANTAIGGLGDASGIVKDATKQAMGLLQPYIKGGEQDYGNYRDKVNSGYYNTPFAGVFNPQQAPQQQGFKPTWNPETQSFSSNRQPYNPAQMGPVSQQALPQWNRLQPLPLPAQGPTQGPGTPMDLSAMLKKALMGGMNQGRNLIPTPDLKGQVLNRVNDFRINGGNPNIPPPLRPTGADLDSQAKAQMDAFNQMQKAPWTMSIDDMINMVRQNKPGRSGPYGFSGGMG